MGERVRLWATPAPGPLAGLSTALCCGQRSCPRPSATGKGLFPRAARRAAKTFARKPNFFFAKDLSRSHT